MNDAIAAAAEAEAEANATAGPATNQLTMERNGTGTMAMCSMSAISRITIYADGVRTSAVQR